MVPGIADESRYYKSPYRRYGITQVSGWHEIIRLARCERGSMRVKKNHILLVEDNPDDELLALRALKKNNILNEVRVARDGAEALDYLEGLSANESLPELILLDLQLPKISGLEVLKAIRENSRTQLLPVVILTSSDEEQDLMRSYQLGANSYIRKPVDFSQFVEAVQQLGIYWLVLNLTPSAK